MKCIVFGYHNIGCVGIETLLKNGFEIVAVFTHRDNPNENTWFESVANIASKYGINVYTFDNINHHKCVDMIKAINPEIVFSFYFRDILKKEILDIPKYGCINLHGSLLPKYRGRAPLNWVIVNGESKTGVSLHYMIEKVDAGDIIGQNEFAIENCDTAKSLHLKAKDASLEILNKYLPNIRKGIISAQAQNESDATYFGGRKPSDGKINWTLEANNIRNLIRAVTLPYPGAYTFAKGKMLFVWSASVVKNDNNFCAGEVISSKPLVIACGKNALELHNVQLEGDIIKSAKQFAKENRISKNMFLG